MVTFTRVAYAEAFARGEIQATILREAASGRSSLDGIDADTLDARVRKSLPPLPTSA